MNRDERLALADQYEAGLEKMKRAGYVEFDQAIREHEIVIAALRQSSEREAVVEVSPSDPCVIIAGIRQFGLAPDGSDLRDLEAALRAAGAALANTRKALEPFAREAELWTAEAPDDFVVRIDLGTKPARKSRITVGDLRRAIHALKGAKP